MYRLPACLALAVALISLTPSMLPRTGLFQGVLCALTGLLGYGLGALLGWLISSSRTTTQAPGRTAGRGVGIVALVLMVTGLILYQLWQAGQRSMLEMTPQSSWQLIWIPVVGLLLFAVLLIVSRSVRWFVGWLLERIEKILPRRVAAVLAVLVVGLGLVLMGNRVLLQRVTGALDTIYLNVNDEFLNELEPPNVTQVSSGPGSKVSWEDLGRQGRLFIANTPSQKSVQDFTGGEAAQPIRVYVGAGNDGQVDLSTQAEMAVAELERTGAFDRAVLNVATGTGRGWVNENQMQALEYMWAGDTATVSLQYSYLPSWMSFLIDSSRAEEAGRSLFDAVYERWLQLPTDQRPKLVVSGESLGSFGTEAAFSGAQDLATRTDGALFVGPAAGNPLWGRFTQDREAGSPQYLPEYQQGKIVRFSVDGENWLGSGTWGQSKVGYLQHSNDPISWANTSVFTQQPDWIRSGQRPENIPDAMVWIPVITGIQLYMDQIAPGIPDGQGHEFGQVPARAWAQILAPEQWEQADTERLVGLLADSQPAR